MKKTLLILAVPLLLAMSPRPSFPEPEAVLQKACLAATIAAIDEEIPRCKKWIDGAATDEEREGRKTALARLEADRASFRNLKASEYRLPEPMTIQIWFSEGKPGIGSLVQYPELSRSGPWYIVAGISGKAGKLKPETKYSATVYKVYPRDYFGMQSSYVYLSDIKAAKP